MLALVSKLDVARPDQRGIQHTNLCIILAPIDTIYYFAPSLNAHTDACRVLKSEKPTHETC